MNLWPGTLRRAGGRVWVELPGGPLPLESYPFRGDTPDAPDGRAVTVGLRPEDVCIHASDDTRAACFELPVIDTEPLGATCIVWCQFGTERLAAMIDSHSAALLPSRLRLRLRADRISLFCARSAARL
jgi:ABC-type sugar transport system ATPase subunit